MANFPTVASPWYVVQQHIGHDENDVSAYTEYYTCDEQVKDGWSDRKGLALLFMSLPSAARIAAATNAEIRVLTTQEHAKEFERA